MEFNGLVDFSEEVNQMNFTANVLHANLFKLNIDKSDPSSFATFILKANGKGSGIDNLNGEINVLNSFFYKNEKQIQLYDLSLNVHNTPEKDLIRLTSDAVDVNIEGKYKIKTLKKSLFALLYKYFPSFNKAENVTDIFAKNENDFSFEVMLKNTSEFTSFFIPELKINNQTSLYGRYAPSKNHITLHAEASGLSFKKNKWKNFYINLTGDTTDFAIESGSSTLTYLEDLDLENFTFFIAGINDSLNVKARWNNWDTTTYKGLIESNFIFSERKNKRPAIKAELLPSKVIMRDSVWNISLNSLTIDSSMIDINDLSVNQKKESFTINGRISKNPSDQLKITFNDFDLGGSDVIFPKEKVKFEGIVNGETTIKDFYNNLTLTSDLEINTFSFNHQLFGNTDLVANWSNLNKKVNIEAISKIKDIETFHLSGDYKPSTKNMDFYLLFDKIDLGIIEPFLSGVFSDITGLTSGELFVSGFINKPLVNGTLNLRKSGLTVDYLKTRYTFNDQVKLVNNNFYFEEITLNDSKGSTAVLNGSISNAFFRDFNLNINIFPENFLMLNTSLSNNEDFYGNANVSGKVGIYGPLDNINFNITVSTNKGTQMYIPLSTGIEEVASYNFIKIKSPDQQESLLVKDYPENLSGIQMNFDLDITPDAEVQMIFDSKVGDIIRARGEGNLILEVDTKGKFTMFGDYTISEGEYLFTMQNIVNKRFKIKKGGLISWNGDPLDANIDLTAVYPTKASPENLFIGEEAELYSKRIPVECELRLTDDLTDPDIFFDILLPSTDQELRAKVKSKLNTEEELTKQFISLLVFNNFMIDSPQKQFASTGQSSGANLGKVTTFEMLSNQFSHYLSQWSKDFDIGVYYRPEDEVSQQEFEVELSTKVLNDRVSINTNLEIGGDEYDIERPGTTSDGDITQTSNIVGEFEIDVQIDKAGKWHFKAFNRANDYYAYRSSEYTQGVSLEFKENFNSFNELVRNFFGENKKDK
jgi:hypothetical protein